MNILYYLTAHGYGHALRSCAICNEFSREVRVTFRTFIPRKFFQEETRNPFGYFPGQFDCGCIQKDSVTVNREETLITYMKLAVKNEARLGDEVKWCLDERVDGIVSDITPFAFEVAKKAGLPSIAVTNFTWFDIYEPYVKDYPAFYPYLQKIREQYQLADFLVELMPSNEMPYFGNRVKVSLLGRTGRCIRDRLKNKLGLAREKHMGLIYVGEFGMNSIPWKNLEKFKKWDFIGIYPLPGEPANYHLVKKEDFLYPDLVASAEVMISKIGYGVFSECQLNGTPLIYLPREDFAEYPVLEKALNEWGHGFCLSRDDYCSLNWEKELSEVGSRKRPEPQPSDASRICAREIEEVVRRGRPRAKTNRGR
jgi:hypothetical protein